MKTLTALVLASVWTATAAFGVCGNGVVDGSSAGCLGDCDGDGSVTVEEILSKITIVLGLADFSVCPAGDADESGSITVDEIITCVNNVLHGCPGSSGGPAEQCDDGGRCIGGTDAGEACTSEADCDAAQGACFGGSNDLRACTGTENCDGSPCRRCRPYGGDGCAANCTNETGVGFHFVPGVVADPYAIVAGTTGAVVFATFLTVPLPLVGTQQLDIGSIVDGVASVSLPAAGHESERIPISTAFCICVRRLEARTCGGLLFETDGTAAANCTAGFANEETCPPARACAAVHGPGNSGSGFIRCGSAGVTVDVMQDCNGTSGAEPFDPVVSAIASDGTPPAGEGNAFLWVSGAIGRVVGFCDSIDASYGADNQFCTDDDPLAIRGTPISIPLTTGRASGTVLSPGDFEGDISGPFPAEGAPFTCDNENQRVLVSGADVAASFTACGLPTIYDAVVPINFAAE